MKSKLNLTVDEKLLIQAKKYAAKNNISISQLFEKHLEYLTSRNSKQLNILDLLRQLPQSRFDPGTKSKDEYYLSRAKKYGF